MGISNQTGSNNSFFGTLSGYYNTGSFNAFFGAGSGNINTSGSQNTFVGFQAGPMTSSGANNTIIGFNAGFSNTVENNNTFIGANSNGAPAITNATAIGSNALVTQSNSLVLGSVGGGGELTPETNVGIGTTAPKSRLHVEGGNVLVSTGGQGVILKSPNGSVCRKLAIDNFGTLVVSAVSCP